MILEANTNGTQRKEAKGQGSLEGKACFSSLRWQIIHVARAWPAWLCCTASSRSLVGPCYYVLSKPSHLYLYRIFVQVGGGKPKMRYYFGANGWPKSTLGGPPETDGDKDILIDSLQVSTRYILYTVVALFLQEQENSLLSSGILCMYTYKCSAARRASRSSDDFTSGLQLPLRTVGCLNWESFRYTYFCRLIDC